MERERLIKRVRERLVKYNHPFIVILILKTILDSLIIKNPVLKPEADSGFVGSEAYKICRGSSVGAIIMEINETLLIQNQELDLDKAPCQQKA